MVRWHLFVTITTYSIPMCICAAFFADRRGEYVFLVDEAHNLVDRAREMYSSQLSKADFLAAKKRSGQIRRFIVSRPGADEPPAACTAQRGATAGRGRMAGEKGRS